MSFSDLLKPKWKNSNKEIRLKGVEKLQNQHKLFLMALNDQDLEVRLKALNKLYDQDRLVDLVSRGKDLALRKQALNEITDQDKLFVIVSRCEDQELRRQALSKITDQDKLFVIVSRCEDQELRKQALNEITDQGKLVDIVLKEKDLELRRQVFNKITDQDRLTDIVSKGKDVEFRRQALSKITDISKLELILETEFNNSYSKTFLSEVIISRYLMEVASDPDLRNMSRNKYEQAAKKSDSLVLNILQKLITNAEKEHSSRSGINYLGDKLVSDYGWLYDYGWGSQIKLNTCDKSDETFLTLIAKKCEIKEIRKYAIGGLSKEETLEYIAINDQDKQIRWKAAEKVNKQKLYERMIFTDEHYQNQHDAFLKIREKITDDNLFQLFKKLEQSNITVRYSIAYELYCAACNHKHPWSYNGPCKRCGNVAGRLFPNYRTVDLNEYWHAKRNGFITTVFVGNY